MPARVGLSFLRANGMTIVEKKPKESHPFASPAKSEAHGGAFEAQDKQAVMPVAFAM
jgi:hypothetical protein